MEKFFLLIGICTFIVLSFKFLLYIPTWISKIRNERVHKLNILMIEFEKELQRNIKSRTETNIITISAIIEKYAEKRRSL